MPTATVFDRHGRRIVSRIVPDGGRVSVAMPFMDARAVQMQRAFLRDAVLHRPGYAQSAIGDGFEATVSSQRSQSAAEIARQQWINRISNQYRQTWQAMPSSAHKPKPGLGDEAEDGDPSERAYERYKQRLSTAWMPAHDDGYDVDDNATMGIQRADVPYDVAQMSLNRQNAYVEAWNAFVEQNPEGTEEEADEVAREAVEALGSQDSVADAAAHLERVRDRIHEATKRRLEGAWRQR
jgi:hypothetical protein